MLMGVCHTEKVLHQHNREQTVEEALASNQATYKPCAIFSAGPVTILQELDDGRMLIQVDNELRLRRVEEQQTLPFSIWSCEELHDEPCSQESELVLKQSQAKILQRLIVITHGNEQAQKMLKSAHWQTMAAQKFSFAVAGLLGMEAETAQALLELTNAQKRLDCVLEMINGIGPAVS
jgi:Lon protease-like protein